MQNKTKQKEKLSNVLFVVHGGGLNVPKGFVCLWISVFRNWPQCPSTNVEVVVVVVVEMVRCLRWGWSRMEVCREASDPVLCTVLSWKSLLLIGVLTAEKESVFLGVAAWLRDKDRDPKLDWSFLLLCVLKEQRQTGRTVSEREIFTFGHTNWTHTH